MSCSSHVDSLPPSDVRAIVHLLADVTAAPEGHRAQQFLLMDGLSSLIRARAWLWAIGGCDPPAAPYVTAVHRRHIGDEGIARLMDALDHPAAEDLVAGFAGFLRLTGRHSTWRGGAGDRPGTADLAAAWRAAGLGPLLLSCRPLPDGGLSCVALCRAPGEEPFDPREAKIAHIALTETPWLHLAAWPESRRRSVPRLHPRQCAILDLLIEGRSRKQVAERLDLRLNTVHGYVKEIYRRFSVHSHGELMARLAIGDGGDTAVPAVG